MSYKSETTKGLTLGEEIYCMRIIQGMYQLESE